MGPEKEAIDWLLETGDEVLGRTDVSCSGRVGAVGALCGVALE